MNTDGEMVALCQWNAPAQTERCSDTESLTGVGRSPCVEADAETHTATYVKVGKMIFHFNRNDQIVYAERAVRCEVILEPQASGNTPKLVEIIPHAHTHAKTRTEFSA